MLAALRNLFIFLTGLSSFSAFFFFFTVALEVTGSWSSTAAASAAASLNLANFAAGTPAALSSLSVAITTWEAKKIPCVNKLNETFWLSPISVNNFKAVIRSCSNLSLSLSKSRLSSTWV